MNTKSGLNAANDVSVHVTLFDMRFAHILYTTYVSIRSAIIDGSFTSAANAALPLEMLNKRPILPISQSTYMYPGG